MLTIRDQQLQAFSTYLQIDLEDRGVAYLRSVLPDTSNTTHSDDLLRSVRFAITKCRQFGLEREFDLFRYLNLMYILGFDFDSDPKYPFVAEILSERSMVPRARMDWLVDTVEQMFGEDETE